jgi:hypothetical protein
MASADEKKRRKELRTVRKDKRIERPTDIRTAKTVIRVFTEGTETEPAYVEALKKLPGVARNAALSVELVSSRPQPLELMRSAVALRGRDQEINEIWCLFDVEAPQRHPHLDQALELAEKHGIDVGVSNPCFEVWLLMHARDVTAYLTTDDAETEAQKLPGVAGKVIDASKFVPQRTAATLRARRLEEQHAADGAKLPDDNPSSSVYKFVESIERFVEPEPN